MKKKVDERIRGCIEGGVERHHRSVLMLVGDRGKYQVANLHYMLSRASVKATKSVLWCYKSELGFSSNRKKRMRHIQRDAQRGLGSVQDATSDPFELFISSTKITYTFYHESDKVLGQTFGMCVLQDFEAITPNLLARCLESVQGGGLIVILIRTMNSLRALYSMSMDAHAKFKTDAFRHVIPRFNERFLLSLCACPVAIIADDELNVLPVTQNMRKALTDMTQSKAFLRSQEEAASKATQLAELKKSFDSSDASQQLLHGLLKHAKTLDQGRALLGLCEAIGEKTLRSTVALTAARGRGKSATLGLAIAMAIGVEYSNIFVSSPAPENVQTLFEFVIHGLQAMGYEEHEDYEILKSSASSSGAILRINVFRSHRQSVQYIDPRDAATSGMSPLTQAELLVIDEAAAIPLPIVRNMLGPYLVFLCSTISGYEGTGRSLSLKLFQELRKDALSASGSGERRGHGRLFQEVSMVDPIRYAHGDPVEAWLNDLLCLDCGSASTGGGAGPLTSAIPHPDECLLYRVDRDALFSRHAAAERFLRSVMALFVSSHYKNSPNDLQMLSDAPAHQLYVLLAPVDGNKTRSATAPPHAAGLLPDVLVAIQVCLEGNISEDAAAAVTSRGHRASGDLIPWTLGQQYQDSHFTSLNGARIVRIATHPDVQKLGYGSRAMKLLLDYFRGNLVSLMDDMETGGELGAGVDVEQALLEEGKADVRRTHEANASGNDDELHHEMLQPRDTIPPLLQRVEKVKQRMTLDYVGVSFGLTQKLYHFWQRLGFHALYIRLTPNDLTGEFSCIAVQPVHAAGVEWMRSFHADFRRRILQLLGFSLRECEPGLALALLQDMDQGSSETKAEVLSNERVSELFSPYDTKRLESYSRNLVDYHVVLDLVPVLAHHFFSNAFGSQRISISLAQSAILMCLGLQRKTLDELERTLQLPANQILALFNKMMRKFSKMVQACQEAALTAREDQQTPSAHQDAKRRVEQREKEGMNPLSKSLEKELGSRDLAGPYGLGNVETGALDEAVKGITGSVSVKRAIANPLTETPQAPVDASTTKKHKKKHK
ncbi:RNA cytidine acetyltransferase [Porphyridium purpureum]|uniref:RNA cytidine acetyltransferase n=1 Tax=Porphyridium purpureum TaxID=35688 RepID=A0A5J4YP81_PORPP|nr:RNA cytidine acetyltransferase [Porphyridium purpureum]|eukprot:POR2259..scf249_10